ncbi:MAG: dienelactone hydrolase family protein [Burkholderiaceae bacterium]|nr:dienelactone hydrolase family protein [Burkholderiaceae bacterium]
MMLSGRSASAPACIGWSALPGELVVPPDPVALVVFVHGSGSGRLSPRNQWVARVLQRHRMATLLFDLLTEDEASDRCKVFDIALLSERVDEALQWVEQRAELSGLRIGLFGASTGAAAALVAAATHPIQVAAVVSRGGRPDLAAHCLAGVHTPTLLIVGSEDRDVLELNRSALRALKCIKRLEVVPGATHLFEEPGTLESVAELAAEWFESHLARGWGGAHAQ